MRDFFKKNLLIFMFIAGSLLLFLLFSLLRIKGVFNNIDTQIANFIVSKRPGADSLMYAIFGDFLANTYTLFALLIMLIISFIILGKRRGLIQSAAIVLAFLIAAVGSILLKKMKYIDRPFLVNGYPYWVDGSTDSTYPSTHMAIAFAIASFGTFMFKDFELRRVPKIIVDFTFALLPFLFAISRIICNVHYFSDLLCGSLFGIFVGSTMMIVYVLTINLLSKKFRI